MAFEVSGLRGCVRSSACSACAMPSSASQRMRLGEDVSETVPGKQMALRLRVSVVGSGLWMRWKQCSSSRCSCTRWQRAHDPSASTRSHPPTMLGLDPRFPIPIPDSRSPIPDPRSQIDPRPRSGS
eukprot:1209391-Rhodomonas_salina.1